MMTDFMILHRTPRMDPNERYNTGNGAVDVSMRRYEHAAVVTADSLSDVLAHDIRTMPIGKSPVRPIAVGDLVLDTESNRLWFVAINGFLKARWVA